MGDKESELLNILGFQYGYYVFVLEAILFIISFILFNASDLCPQWVFDNC